MLTSILCMLNSSINNQRLMNQTSFNACRRLNSNFNSISNKDDENNGKVDMSWEYFLRKNAVLCNKIQQPQTKLLYEILYIRLQNKYILSFLSYQWMFHDSDEHRL